MILYFGVLLRNNPDTWYVTDGQTHQLVDELLRQNAPEAASQADAMSVAASQNDAMSVADSEIPEPCETEPATPEYSITVRQSKSDAGLFSQDLKMSRWLELKVAPPQGVKLVGWDRGLEAGEHEYLVPKFEGVGITGDLIQQNAQWVARLGQCISLFCFG